jgi:hypothetical protein
MAVRLPATCPRPGAHVRVVGGAWRGRALKAPPGRATRPTSDRVREAVFDVLEVLLRSAGPVEQTAAASTAPWEGQVVLDLFAGSGALGIEALSRGATQCTFVERARDAREALRENLARGGGGGGGGGGRAGGPGRAPPPPPPPPPPAAPCGLTILVRLCILSSSWTRPTLATLPWSGTWRGCYPRCLHRAPTSSSRRLASRRWSCRGRTGE